MEILAGASKVIWRTMAIGIHYTPLLNLPFITGSLGIKGFNCNKYCRNHWQNASAGTHPSHERCVEILSLRPRNVANVAKITHRYYIFSHAGVPMKLEDAPFVIHWSFSSLPHAQTSTTALPSLVPARSDIHEQSTYADVSAARSSGLRSYRNP
ncbi:hypothetical protein BC835DRAFT_677117 [Cytidiella melzeri]|nr:hypothetical protein BC835DRAFT_308487 [Cytidiella melzeri]KAI0698242.1 hypothetical protein BC835DRAFT_677117 [Cytidiella melzeri]